MSIRTLFFLLPLLLFATWDELFLHEGDPSLHEYVNVITGKLQLSYEDERLIGPVTIPILRSYSSIGAEERNKENSDLALKKIQRVWALSGGWSVLPHLQMLVDPRSSQTMDFTLYLPEPTGQMVSYCYYSSNKKAAVFTPTLAQGQSYGLLSGRTHPKNNRIELEFKKGRAVVFLANGGYRVYTGEYFPIRDTCAELKLPLMESPLRYYLLQEERLPSGHFLLYQYDQEMESVTITLTNPNQDKVYSSLTLRRADFRTYLTFNGYAGISYDCMHAKDRDYLAAINKPGKLPEKISYIQLEKGKGLALESISMAGREELRVTYRHKKVQAIQKPCGIVARFTYGPDVTFVHAIDGTLTRYLHAEGRLTSIDYCDAKERPFSSQKFLWENGFLIAKVLYNHEGQPLLSKTFAYDSFGNVTEEKLYGNLTGQCPGPYYANERGGLEGAESYTKSYLYDEETHLLVEEREEMGVVYKYAYKAGTDLLSRKSTYAHGELLLEESSLYDADHLLIAQIVTDGNLSQHTSYENDPLTGLARRVTKGGITTQYSYGYNRMLLQEDLYDREKAHRYTITTKYDGAKRVSKKTTSLGGENSYGYDLFDNLLVCKEVGSAEQRCTYDAMHNPLTVKQNDKTTTFTYDRRGRLIAEQDPRGATTRHAYNSFGKCIETTLPEVEDEQGHLYSPKRSFAYDVQGNLLRETDPLDHTTEISYSTLQKPTRIVQPDGAATEHIYNKDGTLQKTVRADKTEIHYRYDPLQRLVSKKIGAKEERWHYKGLLLECYENGSGLKTYYTYDSLGQLIEENSSGRRTQYIYDALGFLETTVRGEISHTERHDEEGRVLATETNSEDLCTYTYNNENQKIQATKITSQGEAVDRFAYDSEGRVTLHIDPLGATTQITYDDFHKTVTDPLGNSTIETYDALNRKISLEKRDPQGTTLFQEKFFYNRQGALAKQLTIAPDKTLELLWKHDPMGRITQQIENQERITLYSYDKKGRLITHTQPNGVAIHYSYDALDRLETLTTKDIAYQYSYGAHDAPAKIEDLHQKRTLTFAYNLFGEKIQENDALFWEYDDQGRVTEFVLPDSSGVRYSYSGLHMIQVERLQKDGSPLYAHRYTAFDVNGHVIQEELLGSLGTLTTAHDLLERPIHTRSPYAEEALSFGPSGLLDKKQHTLLGDKQYHYDSLQQLTQEGDLLYDFDALGNRKSDTVDRYNQISKSGDTTFTYDLNGNLLKKSSENEVTEYQYDALNRLTAVLSPEESVFYSYDPLSRLFAKESAAGKSFYLYDHDTEIGSLDEEGNILELKLLGLGLHGEVAAAIAIEKEQEVFLPLHDLQGNIIGLVGLDQKLCETYPMDAFGRESSTSPLSPWRFSSKRHEGALIYFSKRFYDPTLGRWLTPDPLGFAEHRNPYLFVLNSPTNRLDLFGLFSIGGFDVSFQFEPSQGRYYYHSLTKPPPDSISCWTSQNAVGVQGIYTDTMCIFSSPYPLQFSAQEQSQGWFDAGDHLPQFIPPTGDKVFMGSFQNGMDTSYACFQQQSYSISSHLPKDIPSFTIYNRTEGLIKDLIRILLQNPQNSRAKALRHIQTALAQTTEKVNEQARILHIAYSEGARIHRASFEGMTGEQQELIQKHIIVDTVAAALFVPKSHGNECINYYSSEDHIVKFLGRKYMKDPNYDIRRVACQSPPSEKIGRFIDHNFFAPTQQKIIQIIMEDTEKRHGFHKKNR